MSTMQREVHVFLIDQVQRSCWDAGGEMGLEG